MENKQTLIGEVTADQINAWKEQHGEVFAIKVNGHVCYLRKPTRRELSFATTAGKNDPLKFNETLLRGCWLGGSEAIRRDDDKFMGASGVLDKIVPYAEAELESFKGYRGRSCGGPRLDPETGYPAALLPPYRPR